jgi:hypothetical protein
VRQPVEVHQPNLFSGRIGLRREVDGGVQGAFARSIFEKVSGCVRAQRQTVTAEQPNRSATPGIENPLPRGLAGSSH